MFQCTGPYALERKISASDGSRNRHNPGVLPDRAHRPVSSGVLSRRALLGAGVALASARAWAGYNFFSGTYTLTRDELQRLIAKRFPLTRGHGDLFNVSLSDPQLSLDAAANRIAIACALSLDSALLPQPLDGQIAMSSGLRYDPPTRALCLDRPDVQHIALEGLDSRDADRLQRICAVAARKLLQGQALHTFRPEDLTLGLKTYEIGDITVHENDISVQLK